MKHLSASQVAELKTKLETKLAQLTDYQNSVEAADPTNDPEHVNDNSETGDEALESHAILESEVLENTSGAMISEIKSALRRMQEGTYGVDEITKEPIAYERLKLVPEARTAQPTK